MLRIGWPDQFIEHGKLAALREKYGLTAEAALEKARPYLAAMESRRWRYGRSKACTNRRLYNQARQPSTGRVQFLIWVRRRSYEWD